MKNFLLFFLSVTTVAIIFGSILLTHLSVAAEHLSTNNPAQAQFTAADDDFPDE